MQKQFQLKLTSAIAIDGQVRKAGTVVQVTESVAKDLLRRGRAVADASEEIAASGQTEVQAEGRAADEAPPAAAKTGKAKTK